MPAGHQSALKSLFLNKIPTLFGPDGLSWFQRYKDATLHDFKEVFLYQTANPDNFFSNWLKLKYSQLVGAITVPQIFA